MGKNAEKFSTILKDYVSERKKFNPTISESRIAHNLGISQPTFHRMLNYNTYPSVRNLLKLCKSIPRVKFLVSDDILTEAGEKQYEEKGLESLLFRRSFFITYTLALSAHGVTEAEILYCMGHKGKKALKTLLERGFVKKVEDKIYRATEQEKNINLSFSVLKRHIKILVGKLKPSDTANNYICYKTETLNKAGIQKLNEALKEAHAKIKNIMEKKEHKGDIPAFAALFSDILFLSDSNKKQIKE